MTKTILILDTTRSAYSINQVLENYNTITVGELKEILDQYSEDTPVMFRNDNGYTYGHIYDGMFDTEEVEVIPDLVVGKKYQLDGWATDVISDYNGPENRYISMQVTILDEPDESGWVLARLYNYENQEQVDMFVSVDNLEEL